MPHDSNTRFSDWLHSRFLSAKKKRTADFKLSEARALSLCCELVANDGVELLNLITDSFGIFFLEQLELPFFLGQDRREELRNDPITGKTKEEWLSDAIWRHFWLPATKALGQKRKSLSDQIPLIHSYEAPLRQADSSKARRIDLLGTTDKGLPAVIEVKKGERWTGLSALFCQIVQGLAYALTIRYLWSREDSTFYRQWQTLHGAKCSTKPQPLSPADKTPIVAIGDDDYWGKRQRTFLGKNRSRNANEFGPAIKKLISHLNKAGMPVYLFKVSGYRSDRPDESVLTFTEKPVEWLD